MSASKQTGYQCEFVESVPEHFLCSKCTLVARRLCFTSCCGESYCHGCITSSQTEGHPCPSCGEDKFTALDQIKFQKKIKCQQVYCSMKERGCSWTGSLVDLDTHLDPQRDNSCQYVDVQCPLNCQLAIPKCKLEDHMTKECVKRDHTCQHCGFKATYEEVLDVHLPQCKYVPVQCPNFCGVTCEREDLELHMKMCRLEEVVCQFSGVGCEDKFLREKEDEHVQQNILQHVSLTASAFIQEKMLMDQKRLSQNIELEEKLCQQEDKIGQQEDRIRTLEQKLIAQELLLAGQVKQVEVLKKHLEDQNENEHDLSRLFVMEDFRSKQVCYRQGTAWNSPSMYSKRKGYKFYLDIFPSGCRHHGQSLCVMFQYVRGDFDGSLKWPVSAEFTLVLCDSEKTPWVERHANVSHWINAIRLEFVMGLPCCHISIPHTQITNSLQSKYIEFHVSKSEFH